jgi:hypothetical protein
MEMVSYKTNQFTANGKNELSSFPQEIEVSM